MPFVPRDKQARAKMRGLGARELRTRILRCGHATHSEPISTIRGRSLFRCPEGCGLQSARKRSDRLLEAP